jgi:hypothetical protein
MRKLAVFLFLSSAVAIGWLDSVRAQESSNIAPVRVVERLDPELDGILSSEAGLEVIPSPC